MTIEIVLARYNENIDWVKQLNNKIVKIYNKGEDDIVGATKLENVGRETQTYFYHIVKNYDNLSDWTFFSQAKPFDHVNNFIELVNNVPLSFNSAIMNIENGCYFFSNGHFRRILSSESSGAPHHFERLNIDDLWGQLFQHPPPNRYDFTAGCIFAVSKEKILNRDLGFYEKCLKITEERYHAPWEFERMMHYLFKSDVK